MPYASHIQVVNDANGTAYAFLADNGAIWQCQWDAQAGSWQQGQVVPQAFGGEKLQALYLEDLWPTENLKTTGANPGIVLAYRLGEGSSAEIWASFGTWGDDGELGWTQAVQLTKDQVNDQAFALVEGEAGGFALVVQKKEAGSVSPALLEQLKADTADAGQARLAAEFSGIRPDSDLYVNQYKLSLASSNTEVVLKDLTAGQTSAPIVSAATPALIARAPLAFSGISQPTRQQLINPLATAAASNTAAPATGGQPGSSWTGHFPVAQGQLGGGSLRVGVMGESIMRWTLDLPADYYSRPKPKKVDKEDKKGEKPGYELTYHDRNSGSIALDTSRSSNAGLDNRASQNNSLIGEAENLIERSLDDGDPTLPGLQKFDGDKGGTVTAGFNAKWRGAFGIGNFGADGLTSISFAKLVIGYGNESTRSMLSKNINAMQENLFSSPASNTSANVGGGGSTLTAYQYSNSLSQSPNLTSVSARESVGLDFSLKSLRFSAAIQSTVRLAVGASTGYAWSQSLSSEKLPQSLARLGYASGILGGAERFAFTSYGYQGKWKLRKKDIGLNIGFDKVKNQNYNALSGSLGGAEAYPYLAAANAAVGTLLSFVGPASIAVMKGNNPEDLPEETFSNSQGIQAATRLTAACLFYGLIGAEINLGDRYSKYLFGDKKGQWEDTFFANAGVALPLGGMVPLVSYLHTWKSQPAASSSTGGANASQSSNLTSNGAYAAAGTGADYPFAYTPASANNAFYSAAQLTTSDLNSGLLGTTASKLQLLTLTTYEQGLNTSTGASATLPLTLVNAGSNLIDGTYSNVAILGVIAQGDPNALALANFTVAAGSIVADTFKIVKGGSYLGLPEGQTGNGIYALILDVFTTGIASLPDAATGSIGGSLADLPLITVDSSSTGSPLSSQPIQRVQSIAVTPGSQLPGLLYPMYDPISGQVSAPISNNNAIYIYSNVAVSLFSSASTTAIALLNPVATATVQLSNGVILGVALDQPLLLPSDANPSSALAYSVQLALPEAVVDYLGASSTPPTYAVTPTSIAFNNYVEDEQFSSQPGNANSGVYLAAGLSDQLPLYSSMGQWEVQNRVTYVTTTGSGSGTTTSITYLNGFEKNPDGSLTQEPAILPSQLSLEAIYNHNNNIVFSAASTPTTITLAGDSTDTYAGKTFVAWVEASQAVVPLTSKDGTDNFQTFMQSMYGSQRINYRINQGDDTSWLAPSLADLYYPDNAIIRELKAFNCVNPNTHQMGNLLVWSEVSIDAVKGAIQQFGSAASIPATLKAGWLNANPANYQWANLFIDASGNSTIQEMPWEPAKNVGLGISDISIASLPLAQTVNGSTSISETAVVSWSQDVRTPYRQSVLGDDPYIYLQFGQLQSGLNNINIGSTDSVYTSTTASDTGLNFGIAGALPADQSTAVQNSDGTGILTTGMGSLYAPIRDIVNNIPVNSYQSSTDPSGIGVFIGSINGTALSVTSVSQGSLRVGDEITGPGIAAGTTITAIGAVASNGTGTYSVDQAQVVASVALEAIPAPTSLPISTFSASISGTTLSVSQLTAGSLSVGDVIIGEGVTAGTTITAIGSFDASSGTGSFTVNNSQTLATSALLATPGTPTVPYTIEFWAQLQPGSNAKGAGLVALGQPSNAAVGAFTMPDGWLLSSSFVVDQITYQQAVERGLISSIPASVSTPSTAVYAWGWAVVAAGANTTALNGTGGANLYSNSLLINNLVSGINLKGINQFLANYNLSSGDLTGIDGNTADIAALVPQTQLQFSNSIDSTTKQVNSSLNAIAVNTDSAILNEGLVLVNGAQAISSNLETMFNALWAFQLKTGEAKVNLSLAPDSTSFTTTTTGATPSQYNSESYAGYELGFSLTSGTALSVNGEGQLVFDIGRGSSLTSAALGSVPADLRDGQWHHIVASYLPTYQAYSVADTVTQIATNVGTASLYIDNTLVASNNSVIDAYAPINLNDQALLLAGNVGGAIDELAIYDKALSTAAFTPNTTGGWPTPSTADALALLADLGYGIATKTPDPGSIPGAVTSHWQARNVNPNDALLGTYYSVFSAGGANGGSWSEASNLNPSLKLQATLPSASQPGSLQDALVISVAPLSWMQANAWTLNGSGCLNPSRQRLTGISVQLTSKSNTTETTTLNLTADQVLLGGNSLATLQPRATDSNFQYEVLTDTPAFNLIIDRDQLPHASGTSPLADTYSATYTFKFDGTYGAYKGESYQLSNANPITFNSDGAAAYTIATTGIASQTQITRLEQHEAVIATAAVLEQAPVQLKYIDSGEVLKSASSVAAANDSAASSPANSFGTSQVAGSYIGSNGNSYGWLAIAQPICTNAISNPAGRVWLQYTGQSLNGKPTTDAAQAPTTWLNALARSNFSPESPNLPLLGNATNPSNTGGLLIEADPTTGWDQNFGKTMLVADVNGDGSQDLVIAAPQANGGGKVYIIDGSWIRDNLTNANGVNTINLANANNLGAYVKTLTASAVNTATDIITVAGFGTALAYDTTTSTLLVGAPNYVSQLDPSNTSPSASSLQAIGAVYSYTYTAASSSWSQKNPPMLGSGGTMTSLDPSGSPTTSYWGSKLGSAIAVDDKGAIAISAPGVVAAMEYSGTKSVLAQALGEKTPDNGYGDGALLKIQVANADNNFSVSIAKGTNSPGLQPVANQSATETNATELTTHLKNVKELLVDRVTGASVFYNQALQANAVGAVYLLNQASDLLALSAAASINAQSVAALSSGGATFYGPQVWNTLGESGFGSSLSFGDYNNSNSKAVLAIGASQYGGAGAVYLVNTDNPFTSTDQADWLTAINLGSNQYLANLASSFSLYGAESQDHLGSGLVNLGDVNNDGYDDLLVQAYNASSSAGTGYVLFGSDTLTATTAAGAPNTATASVAPGSIGVVTRADGSTFTTAILTEIGSGLSSYTGQGTFGSGDINGDGFNDILLGSGPNGSAYLTWGQSYLEAINNLQLSKLTSSTGYRLDGLATTTKASLRSIGDFNNDGYDDFISINPGSAITTVRLQLGANTQEALADYLYNYYTFTVKNGTKVAPAGDVNGDGFADIALFLNQDGSDISLAKGGSAGILYGRASGDLPIGAGFGLLAPVDASGAPRSSLPGLGVSHGFTDATPTVISVGTTLYAVVKGYGNTHLYFTQSTDAGSTWNSWTDISALTPGLATDSAPSLAFLNNKLYLAFLNTNATPTLSLSSWDPTSQNAAAWSTPTQLSDSLSPGAGFSSSHGPQLIDRGDGLGIVWVDASSGTLYGSYSSFLSAVEADNSWSTPSQLLQRVEVDGSATYSPIAASDAPSLTWLADQAVVAVANGSSVNVYAALTNSLSWELASTFGSAAGEAAISTAPVLASTDTGLALTYGSSDGAINLQRLDLLEANGTLRDANQLWLKTTLNHANSGLSSTLATVPLSVNGTLLLSNVRSDDNAIWLNAIPVLDSANSSTWLNSNVPLLAGNGNAIDSQYSRTTDWQSLAGGSSTSAPAFAEMNGVLYAAVRGENDGLWWSSSKDGGQSWQGWQQITNAYSTEYSTTTISPSLAAYDGTLFMSYAYENTLFTTYFDGYGWSELPVIPQDIHGNYFTVQFASLIAEDDSLSIYYVGDDGNIYRTSSTNPWGPLYSYYSQNSLAISDSGGTQASSGNLALARFNNQTYIAYQYGYTTRLTTSADPGTASSWSLLSSANGVPQPKNPSDSGVGLTANNLGLVLSYADEINNEQVVVLQQGTVTASGWSTSSTTNVAAPDASQDVNTSLFSTSGTSAVLLGAINTNANQAITTAFSSLTTTNYGDLNGDGRLDYLAPAGLDSIDTGDKPNFYSVWSIRAAGDVNGNGLDDILLALAANNSDDESIQTVLIDGSLFKISDNTFSLANLRAPLDPYAADSLNIPAADRQSSSNPDNYLPSLQNWIQPILDYIPSTTINSASLSNATTPIQGYEVANDRYYNWTSLSSTVARDGTIFIANQGLGSNNIFLAFGDPNNASPNWQQVQIPGASTDSAPSLAFYNQTLYIAYTSPQGTTDYVNNGLNIAHNTTPGDYSSWTTYSISGTSSVYGPTLVNEGNHLALYFVANDGSSDILSLASTDPTKSSSWGGTYADGAFTGSSVAIADSSGAHQTSSSLISATRFQGKTILAYMSGTYRGGDQTYYWIAEKTSDKTWLTYEIDPDFNNVMHNPCIASDASRLYLTTGYQNPIGSYSYVTAGTSYDTWGAPAALPDAANSIYNTINLASTGSNLYAIWRNSGSSDDLTISPLSLSTDSAVQQSLAGYSIDANVDVNGDGFMDMLVSDPSNPSLGVDSQYVLLGGDYLDIASQVGTDANDSLIGSPLADVIYTLAGDDVVQSKGGADLIYTGSGDDQILIKDNSFWRIDAGSGFDQLLLEGLASQSYDFRLNTPSPQYFAGTKLRDIELISSLDYGANTLYFDASGVNAFNSNRILFLVCDTTDNIVLSNEFKRDTSFDSAYADKIWYAYAANQQGGLSNNAALNGNPALVYVAAPDGASADTWLSQNVSITSVAAPATQSLQARAFTAAAPAPTAMPAQISSSTDLGNGAILLAYKTTSSSAAARFEIRRSNTSERQVFLYASSSTNATSAPGRDYDAVAGLLALEQGASSRQITVPLASAALEQLRNATLSLEVRELQECGQAALHLLIKPAGDPASASALAPVLSDFLLTPSNNAAGASLRFRADSNANSSDLSSLILNISQRSAADSSDSLATKAITLLDAIDPEGTSISPYYNSGLGAQALDNDAKTNDQISARLDLNFKAKDNTHAVSLAAAELNWSNQVQLLGSNSVQFKQDGPLSCWRADSGSGLVSFGFQSAATSLSLLRDASGGSTGSIKADNALSTNPSNGWQTTEGQAIGSRSVVQGLNLVGSSWTPTASRDGQALQLLNLSVEGNQVTANFAGGVTAVFWQAMGPAPTPTPILPAVEVQRLAGFNNSLAFYRIDSITGEVDGLKPGDARYLEAALHRAEVDDLLLDYKRLPVYGESKSFTDLPIDTNLSYGMLLLQNGERSTIFSSFAAANPGAAIQMVSLGSEANKMVLGFEDISTVLGSSDMDFNDVIVSIHNVNVGLF